MHNLSTLDTPCILLDRDILQKNIDKMADRCRELGIALRPHVKTPKSLPVAAAFSAAGAQGFCVSTLKEAETFFAAGYDDLFYTVPIDAAKIPRAAAMLRAGHDLSLLVSSPLGLPAIAEQGAAEDVVLPLWVEIDVDGYRTGIPGDSEDFPAAIRLIQDHPNLSLRGIMSYGGDSYTRRTTDAVAQLTETHRLALLKAADEVQAMGCDRPKLSFGSTPATRHARTLDGIDEVRCGIYAFQDLFQAGIGACGQDEIALSVLTTVISHSPHLNRFTIDAGGLALSKDRSTQGNDFDAGFGLVCDMATGRPIEGLYVGTVSQEIGIVSHIDGKPVDLARFPVGSRLRILPNHADMTAAAYEQYHVLTPEGMEIWARANGW